MHSPFVHPQHTAGSLTRRGLIRAGLMGVAGLSLADVLHLQAQTPPIQRRDTSVIFVLQEGGASQFETYDPKPQAADDIRGEFKAIATNVPGVHFSELMSEQAKIMDKLTVFRSIHHPSTQHSSSVHLIKTGYYCRPEAIDNEMPSVGSYAAKIRGAVREGLPPYALLQVAERYDGGHFLGKAFNPFFVKSDDTIRFQVPNLSLLEGISTQQLQDRRRLLGQFDQGRRLYDRIDADGSEDFQRQAFEMVTGTAAQKAFKLEEEPLALRERYGMNPVGQRLLLARRLAEHGVTFTTLATIPWDHHGDLWRTMKREAPAFDRGVAALVEDLHVRGLEKRVLVVVMGEFGRTPRISTINGSPPGRDHWGDVEVRRNVFDVPAHGLGNHGTCHDEEQQEEPCGQTCCLETGEHSPSPPHRLEDADGQWHVDRPQDVRENGIHVRQRLLETRHVAHQGQPDPAFDQLLHAEQQGDHGEGKFPPAPSCSQRGNAKDGE